MVRVLEAHGHQVAQENDAHLAITVTQGGIANAILIDIASIDVDAKFLDTIRAIDTEQVVIAIASATTPEEKAQLCHDHGITAVLRVPFNAVSDLIPLIPGAAA